MICGGQAIEVHVARVALVPHAADADLRLLQIHVGQADAVEHRLRRALAAGLSDARRVFVEHVCRVRRVGSPAQRNPARERSKDSARAGSARAAVGPARADPPTSDGCGLRELHGIEERHHVPQLGADDLDRMIAIRLAQFLEVRLPGLVLRDPLLRELA